MRNQPTVYKINLRERNITHQCQYDIALNNVVENDDDDKSIVHDSVSTNLGLNITKYKWLDSEYETNDDTVDVGKTDKAENSSDNNKGV